MANAHPERDVWDPELGRRRCTANSKQRGERCRNRPVPGGYTCRFHGSATRAAKRAAQLRLAELVDPAVVVLAQTIAGPDAKWQELEPGNGKRPGVWKRVGIDRADKLRAAENVLDRAGHPRRTEVDTEAGRARLLERIRELRAEQEDA